MKRKWILITGGIWMLHGMIRHSISEVLFATVCSFLLYDRWAKPYPVHEFNKIPSPYQGRPQETIDTWDIVDEASWESFPASDPPAIW